MAATPLDAIDPSNSFVFDIYNDGQALRDVAPVLPGGPCNYTDQSLPRCGCRRFWSRLSPGGALQDSFSSGLVEICMCSHHACFHEDIQSGNLLPTAVGQVAGQENQKPKANREPLSPVQDLPSFYMPSNPITSADLEMLNFQGSVSGYNLEGSNPLHIEDEAGSKQDSPMPDTLNSWGNLIQSQPGGRPLLPSFPPQCVLPSQPPSTASSSQAGYLRPFAGKGLQTLSGGSALRHEARQPEQGAEEEALTALQDAVQGGRDSSTILVRDVTTKAGQSQDHSASRMRNDTLDMLSDTVKGHEKRIDRLENTSFSVAGHEECHDKHEHLDIRVTELESRVEEVEKILNDTSSITSSRRTVQADATADDATASVASVSTNTTILASNRAEIYSQLEELRAQVNQLHAASLPSYTKPWELEVVYLPFPLKGIWMEAREFPPQRQLTGSNADEWTQMPNTVSRSTPDPQSQKFTEWAGQSLESSWLLPRAFAAGRIIDQRLRSRGFIKSVLVRGPDARSIQLAIHNAFGDIFRIAAGPSSRSALHPGSPLSEFLGLRQSWVPLRKIHKDSRLRFLAPAEMATPALWDFTFLVSSVVMKASGVHRLYVTQPEAYLQDQPIAYHAFESGWSWQKLRELTRVYPDSQSSIGDVPEADAMEECWTWNDRFDEVPSANTSAISLRQSNQEKLSRRSSSSLSQQFYTGAQSPILSNSPGMIRAQSPLIQRERKGSRPPQVRTGSLPPVAPFVPSPSQSRRRISSHATGSTPYERRSSPFVTRPNPRLPMQNTALAPISTSAALISKRRLGTRSPSLIPRNTPHWSRTSMSRSTSPAIFAGQPGYHDERTSSRRATPAYYATPHSDALPEHNAYQRAGSRGPINMPLANGYDPDDDDDMDDFEDQGSSTDPYDSQMTDDVNEGLAAKAPSAQNESFDSDIDVYEDDDEDELDEVDTDGGNDPAAWHGFGLGQVSVIQSEHPRPEDIPWAGIEDLMSDGENVDPDSPEIEIHEDEDIDLADRGDGDDTVAKSRASSEAPSEYSSKPQQGMWPVAATLMDAQTSVQAPNKSSAMVGRDASMGFRIHEDGETQIGRQRRGGRSDVH
ncbi:hypothetical protein B0H66DRAFT_138973 [Apodospora peruviana]|uniref:Uncharacterized protein n=1 Tax=Apodospora peruviana TaxID=516989 RepID=A0AAE0MAX4_9PEZI|nr:hypothetical protein B0H66DRAFT_138973 [Apodospora peruviana]